MGRFWKTRPLGTRLQLIQKALQSSGPLVGLASSLRNYDRSFGPKGGPLTVGFGTPLCSFPLKASERRWEGHLLGHSTLGFGIHASKLLSSANTRCSSSFNACGRFSSHQTRNLPRVPSLKLVSFLRELHQNGGFPFGSP